MKNPEYKWVDTAINGANNRDKVVDLTKLKIPQGSRDCYRTIFRFTEEFPRYVATNISFKTNKPSVKGYRGTCYADYFPIDIDDVDLNKSLEKSRNVLNRLSNLYDVELSQIRCFFSGAKGFHIMLPDALFGYYASPKLPNAFKIMAKEILETDFDGSIYEHMRIFRINNTINSKSGNYKIALTSGEILYESLEYILDLSKKPRKVNFCPVDEIDQNELLHEVFTKAMLTLNSDKQKDILAPKVNNIPKDAKLCYYALLEGVGEGERDNAALRLATHFRKQGMPANITYGILQAWDKQNNPPLGQSELEKFVYQSYENNYDFGCRDFLLEKYCDKKCFLIRKKIERVNENNVYSIYELQKKYEEYVAELEKRKINIGIDILDKRLRGVAPGEVMQIMARSGVGKTTIALNIMKNVGTKQGTAILFFSLEMPAAQIYERQVQIGGMFEGEEVEKAFQTKSPDKEIMSNFAIDSYKNVFVVDQDRLSFEELKQYVEVAERKINQKIGLLFIDYLGRMGGKHTREYELISELARQLKTLAKETDKAVIYLHQTDREGGDGSKPVTMDMGRGSGVGEEAADFIIGAWRPEINNLEAQRSPTEPIVLAILKGRKGPLCQHRMCLNKKKLILSEYDMVREAKEISGEVTLFKE